MAQKEKDMLSDAVILETLKAHQDVLKKCRVRKIGLFGPHARGDQQRKSDVDFLVVFDEPTFDNFMHLVYSLEKFLKRKVDIVTEGSLSPYIRPYVEREVTWYEV